MANPVCPYFGRCSGCSSQHIDYAVELENKQKLVARAVGVKDIKLFSGSDFSYRNRMDFLFHPAGLGLRAKGKPSLIIPVGCCAICEPAINKLLLELNCFFSKADFFVVHAKHGLEGYESPADYSVFPECVATGKQIIANGDIDSREKVESLRAVGVAGVMIGRAAVRDPAIFNRLKGLSAPDPAIIRKEYILKSKELKPPFRYQKQVLKHLGNNPEK